MARTRRSRAEREEASHYEVCACKHPRADHGDLAGGQLDALVGHGVCMIPGCRCDHYTWSNRKHKPTRV
jgi:hypothetical protein